MNLYKYMEEHAQKRSMGRCSEMELNKGRFERREIKAYDVDENVTEKWIGVKQFVQVQRTVKKKGKISKETAYFISSIEASALLYNVGIRSHWGIENCLHWVKDVTFKEDASKISIGEAPSVLSTIRNSALNIFRKNGMTEIAKAIRLVSNDIEKLHKLII